jgi:hypothetical protein
MKFPSLTLLFSVVIASGFLTSCESLSTDPAPGGISATGTGMNSQSIREWQDRSIRQLAY